MSDFIPNILTKTLFMLLERHQDTFNIVNSMQIYLRQALTKSICENHVKIQDLIHKYKANIQ